LLRDVPINKISEFEAEYIDYLNLNHKDTMASLARGEYNDEITGVLTKVAQEFTAKYKK
jgi:F-type H+-transporting ATPase subunit alpha